MPEREDRVEERETTGRGWLYASAGDYHRSPPADWIYTTTYERKTELVLALTAALRKRARVVDLGCGEGVFVERVLAQGHQAIGLDLNYASENVVPGDVLQVPFRDGTFDAVLLLDVLEHLTLRDQPAALGEIRRILAPEGDLILTVPNLAHLNSRLRFLLRGQLDRSDQPEEHVGERPIGEVRGLLAKAGFLVRREIGITATIPFLYRGLFARNPRRFRGIQDLSEPLATAWPGGAMYVLLVCTPG